MFRLSGASSGAPEEKAIVAVLVGLALTAGLFLWWRGQAPAPGVDWVAAGGKVPSREAVSEGSGSTGHPGSAGEGSAGEGAAGEGAADASAGGASPVVVHVAGAVVHPGVYSLPAGSRVVDALKSAGGPAPSADPDAVNLARPLTDGERLYIPTRDEVRRAGGDGWAQGGGGGGDGWAQGGGAGGAGLPGSAAVGVGSRSGGKVNLNTATTAELDTLPGIGPTLAARIVDYRTRNGPFTSPEELMNVSGIGAKKYADLAELITVR